jgi:hypothetical protein
MAENAGKRGQGIAFPNSEVQILTFSQGSMPLNPQGYRSFIYCTSPIFEYSTLSLQVLGFGAVIHFL